MGLVDHWPLFGLRVRTPRLEVRCPDDDLAWRLGELAAAGIHDPSTMPFGFPWTDAPVAEIPRNTIVYYWRTRAAIEPSAWHLALAILVDGEPVGAGGLIADDFAVRRTFETGSWLGRAFQRRGLGLEFRHACLHLGFAGLGAAYATTGAFHDNAASLGVTAKLPYEPNGEDIHTRRGVPDRMLRFRMSRSQWETVRRDDIEIAGLEPCLPLLVATDEAKDDSHEAAGGDEPAANPSR